MATSRTTRSDSTKTAPLKGRMITVATLGRQMSSRASIWLTGTDVQAQLPAVHVSLSRVGVTGVEKVIRIREDGGEQLFHAKLDCFVDLGARQKGAHMSRFEEVVNEAIGEVILGEAT